MLIIEWRIMLIMKLEYLTLDCCFMHRKYTNRYECYLLMWHLIYWSFENCFLTHWLFRAHNFKFRKKVCIYHLSVTEPYNDDEVDKEGLRCIHQISLCFLFFLPVLYVSCYYTMLILNCFIMACVLCENFSFMNLRASFD